MSEKRKSSEISEDIENSVSFEAKKSKSSVARDTTKENMAANSATTDVSATSNADTGENCLRDLMLNISKDLTNSISSLGDRIRNLEDNIENKLATQLTNVIHATVKEEIGKVRSDFDSEICAMKTKILDMEKSFADILQGDKVISAPVETDPCDVSIVIRNLKRSSTEEDGISNATKNKVISLVRDGLKLKDIKVVKAERKQSRGDNPGVIVASLETKQQVSEVMKGKAVLRQTNDYRSVYIEPLLSQAELSTQSSLRTILKEMGKEKSYYVNGPRLFPRKTNNTDRDNNPGASQPNRTQSRDNNRPNNNRSRQPNGQRGGRSGR